MVPRVQKMDRRRTHPSAPPLSRLQKNRSSPRDRVPRTRVDPANTANPARTKSTMPGNPPDRSARSRATRSTPTRMYPRDRRAVTSMEKAKATRVASAAPAMRRRQDGRSEDGDVPVPVLSAATQMSCWRPQGTCGNLVRHTTVGGRIRKERTLGTRRTCCTRNLGPSTRDGRTQIGLPSG